MKMQPTMSHGIKFLCILALAILSSSADAAPPRLIVHNQAHYYVSFEVTTYTYSGKTYYHSGNFGIGQTREIEVSGLYSIKIGLNWLPGFKWQSDDWIYYTHFDADETLEVFFWGDVTNPRLGMRLSPPQNWYPATTYHQACQGDWPVPHCWWAQDKDVNWE